jgi:hypothetical protein
LWESGELNPEQQQQQDQLIYRLLKADLELTGRQKRLGY